MNLKELNVTTAIIIGVGGLLAYRYMQKKKAENLAKLNAQLEAQKQENELAEAEAEEEGEEGLDSMELAMKQQNFSNATSNNTPRGCKCGVCISQRGAECCTCRNKAQVKRDISMPIQTKMASFSAEGSWDSNPISYGI